MFVGHLAVALVAKRAAPAVSLGWLVAGVTTVDLVWPLFVLTGLERVAIAPGATAFTPLVFESYPWSHSLAMAPVWGIALATAARGRRLPLSSAMLIGALAVTHWVLDFVSHEPDLPLWPGPSPRVGLGLWRSVPRTLVVEGAMWLAAISVYVRVRSQQPWRGRLAFWSLVLVTTIVWATGPWSPPPPSAEALGWFALVGWLVVPWAARADR